MSSPLSEATVIDNITDSEIWAVLLWHDCVMTAFENKLSKVLFYLLILCLHTLPRNHHSSVIKDTGIEEDRSSQKLF